LFEPPTSPVDADSTTAAHEDSTLATLSTLLGVPAADLRQRVAVTAHGSVPHIFSHINMTYHVQHLVLGPADSNADVDVDAPPVPADPRAAWLRADEVEGANVGTGVKKVWAQVFGKWGAFVVGAAGASVANGGKGKKGAGASEQAKKTKRVKDEVKVEQDAVGAGLGGKVVRKIMMPLMPARKA
jgi:A/G-specific adenine glycosylase